MPRLDPPPARISKRGTHTIVRSISSAIVFFAAAVATTTAAAADTPVVDPKRFEAVQALNLQLEATTLATSERSPNDSQRVNGNQSRKTLAEILNSGPAERFQRKMAASNHLHQLRNERVARERAEQEEATGEDRARIDRATSRRRASEVIARHIPKREVDELQAALTEAMDLVNLHREAENLIQLEFDR